MPNLFQRAALALRVASAVMQDKPPSSLRSQDLKAFNYAWPAWIDGSPRWQMVDTRSYAREGYEMNALIHSAIMYKVRQVSKAPLRAYEGDVFQPTPVKPNHPLAMLVSRPNPYMTMMELQGLLEVYLNVSGNAYILLDRKNDNTLPSALYPLPPDRTFIIPKAGKILGYVYVPYGTPFDQGVPILPENLIHVKLPNPTDEMDGLGYGLSPISSMAQSADTDNHITRFLKLFFERGTMVTGFLKYKNPLDDMDIERIKADWKKQHGGYANWTEEIGILDDDADYKPYEPQFDKMGFSVMDERNETRIQGPFGVPPILTGSRVGLMRSTYANYETARKAFWEDTFTYELDLFGQEYLYYLTDPNTGAFVMHDLSGVPALAKNTLALVDSAKKMFDMGAPPRVAFQVVGLKVPQYKGDDIGYLPMGLVPVGSAGTTIPVDNPGAEQVDAGSLEAEREAAAGKTVKKKRSHLS